MDGWVGTRGVGSWVNIGNVRGGGMCCRVYGGCLGVWLKCGWVVVGGKINTKLLH